MSVSLTLFIQQLINLFGLQDVALWLGQAPIIHPQLAEPRWLLILVLPLGLLFWRWRQRRRLVHYADPALAPWATVRQGGGRSLWRQRAMRLLLALFWLMLTLALADPRVPKSATAHMQILPPVLFVLDDSAAMSVQDVSPDRLGRSLQLIRLLIPNLADRRVGLMVYADQAGLLLPPSPDHDLLRFFLTQIPALAHPVAAPRPDRAFSVAADLADLKGGAIVWLTSGDEASFSGTLGSDQLAAAERLKQAGLRLIAVTEAGAGGPMLADGQPIKDNEANPLSSRPAPQRVAELARLTGGAATTTTTLPADAAFIDHEIQAMPELPPRNQTAKQTRSLHSLPLLIALLCLIGAGLMGFPPVSRRTSSRLTGLSAVMAMATVLSATGGIVPTPVQAAEPAESTGGLNAQTNRLRLAQADLALVGGDFAQAQVLFSASKGYAARLGNGIAAYRRADFTFAATQFQMASWLASAPAEQALALFNLGDALVMTGQYDAAFDAFSAVLAIQPQNKDAQKNRDLVDKFRKSISKNEKDSPKFKGYQSATYGYYHEPKTSKMDQAVQQSSGGVNGAGGPTTVTQKPGTPFALTEAIGASARKKLDLVNDQPAPLLDGLLRQQPYQAPMLGDAP
ncbi:MAG TPA: VWA domain-containing protein [Halothiobacillus sp.]|nr:VWA domain-containing protein [Halothiobacillus sp.]